MFKVSFHVDKVQSAQAYRCVHVCFVVDLIVVVTRMVWLILRHDEWFLMWGSYAAYYISKH